MASTKHVALVEAKAKQQTADALQGILETLYLLMSEIESLREEVQALKPQRSTKK